MAKQPIKQVGLLRINPARRLIEGPGGHAYLEPLIMRVLLLLVDARGEVVARDTLFEYCWGGTIVGDDSLNHAIAKVRRAGRKVAPGLFEVETIPRTGYRLTGQILEESPDTGAPLSVESVHRVNRRGVLVAGTAAVVGIGSLAVWSNHRRGIDSRTETLVARAEQSIRYEYAGRELGQPSSDVRLLEQALAISPDNPKALGLLAYLRARAATGSGDSQQVQAADDAIKAALAVDPNDPHVQLALLLFRGERDWVTTEDRLSSALATSPQNTIILGWLVALYQAAGRNKLSWNLNEETIKIDPISPSPQYRKALKLWIFGRPDEAFSQADRLLRIWPRHAWVWNARFLILAFTGRPHAALDMIDDASTRPATITPQRMAQWRPTLRALETSRAVDLAVAREVNLAAAKQSPGQAAYAVMALSGIQEIDAAYEVAEGFLLSKGRIVTRQPTDRSETLVNNAGWRQTQWLSTPPLLPFRADPRFSKLCDGIGLTAYWKTRGVRPDYPTVQIT